MHVINEEKLDNMLLELGHDDFNRGTAYLRQAVKMYEPGVQLTKELYPEIGKARGTTGPRVERCMRHSIDKAWRRGSVEAQHRYFGFSINPNTGKPQVGEYIARLSRMCEVEELDFGED